MKSFSFNNFNLDSANVLTENQLKWIKGGNSGGDAMNAHDLVHANGVYTDEEDEPPKLVAEIQSAP